MIFRMSINNALQRREQMHASSLIHELVVSGPEIFGRI